MLRGDSKFAVGMNVAWIVVCLSVLVICVMNWRPVVDLPNFSPYSSLWAELNKWMDGWVSVA